MARKSPRREQSEHRNSESLRALNQCYSAVARAVIVDRQPLREAWKLATRAQGLRDVRIDQFESAIIGALSVEAELFGGDHYAQRLAESERAQLALSQLLAPRLVHVTGLAARGLAPDTDVLELLLYVDEAEAVLRDLLDRQIDYQPDQRRWSIRRDGAEHIHPAILLGTPWMDASVALLPRQWERSPLYQQGQAIWTSKLQTR